MVGNDWGTQWPVCAFVGSCCPNRSEHFRYEVHIDSRISQMRVKQDDDLTKQLALRRMLNDGLATHSYTD